MHRIINKVRYKSQFPKDKPFCIPTLIMILLPHLAQVLGYLTNEVLFLVQMGKHLYYQALVTQKDHIHTRSTTAKLRMSLHPAPSILFLISPEFGAVQVVTHPLILSTEEKSALPMEL